MSEQETTSATPDPESTPSEPAVPAPEAAESAAAPSQEAPAPEAAESAAAPSQEAPAPEAAESAAAPSQEAPAPEAVTEAAPVESHPEPTVSTPAPEPVTAQVEAPGPGPLPAPEPTVATAAPEPTVAPAPDPVAPPVPEPTVAPPAPEPEAPAAAGPAPQQTLAERDQAMGMAEYEPQQVTHDDLGATSLEDAIAGTIVEFDEGDIVNGTVVKVDKDEVLLDIGYKSEGVIPNRELSIRHDVDPNEVVTLGDKIEALVLQKEDKEGRLILSKKRAQYERAWGTIEQIKQAEGVVEGPVIEVVKGGLILDIGLRGFLPASLVELRRVRDLQPYVGRTLQAKIIELDKNRNNVVLSRRAHLEETQREARDEFLANLKPGEVRRGVVSSVVNFGAFVDLGGMDGLVHVSELSWKHVDHPSSVVQVGDEVTVQVLDVDLSRERISLSLKATQQDPWQQFASGHRVGELVYGRVTKLVPFGAFVQVGEGIEGLVHISEMAAHHVDLPDQVVSPGEELWVKIIDLDLERRRISLSIKQAAEGGTVAAEYQEIYGEHAYDEHGNYIGPAFEEGAHGEAGGAGEAGEVPEAAPAEQAAPAEEAGAAPSVETQAAPPEQAAPAEEAGATPSVETQAAPPAEVAPAEEPPSSDVGPTV